MSSLPAVTKASSMSFQLFLRGSTDSLTPVSRTGTVNGSVRGVSMFSLKTEDILEHENAI